METSDIAFDPGEIGIVSMRRHNAVPGIRAMRFAAVRCAAALACLPLLALNAVPQTAETERKSEVVTPETPAPPLAKVTPIQIANLPLGVVTFQNGKAINLNVAMGSAAFRLDGDAQGRVWLLTDRGPNIPCADARKYLGIEPDQVCGGNRAGFIYPLPGFVPSIYAVDIGADDIARINVFIPLKGKSGRPISGRPGPRSEPAFGIDGKALPPDTSGVDPKGFVRLKEGSFWIAEAFGPSLLEVASDGTVRKRLVPASVASEFKDADYDIVPSLPPVLLQRLPSRGFEGLAVSPDENYLFAVMQSPLANPDALAARHSRNLRIWKIERKTGQVVGQYLYQLDEPVRFKADNALRERMRSDIKVSEIVAFGDNQLLVLERIEKSSRLYAVTLDEAGRIPPEFDSLEMSPSLEILEGEALTMRGLVPLQKRLILDSDSISGLPGKIEGVAILSPDELVVINDNEFGIDGVRNQMFRITLPEPLLR
jgi:hypothetical protein